MNSSTAPRQERRPSLAGVWPTFNWIEYIIMPVASSIMEAQPIALVLLFIPIFFLGTLPSGSGLDMGAIVLILSGLHWWALFTHALTQRREHEQLARFLQLMGLALTAIAVCGLQLLAGNSIADLIIPCLVVIWGWRRGNLWTRKETHDEQLVMTFKVGFITLIVILLITILRYVQASAEDTITVPKDYVFTVLAQALPLFFLASLVALSFTRLEMIRKDSKRNTLGSSRLDPTRSWRLILMLAWVVLIVMCFALETFALTPLSMLFAPIWNLVLALLNLLLYILFVVLSVLVKPALSFVTLPRSFPQLMVPSVSKAHSASNAGISPVVTLVMLAIIVCIVLVVVLLIVRAVLTYRRRMADEEDMNEVEERERLSLTDILQKRSKQRRQDVTDHELESLEPGSARARYRELLQAASDSGANVARQAYETPYEYQRRLASLLFQYPLQYPLQYPESGSKIRATPTSLSISSGYQTSSKRSSDVAAGRATREEAGTSSEETTPPGSAILAELTDAYVGERYGGKPLAQPRRNHLGKWIPDLLRRLTGIGSQQQTSTPQARLPNKWGD